MTDDIDPRNERNFERIAQAIAWINAHSLEQPAVARMAAAVSLSEAHFSRLFRRWAGISPQRYLAHVTLNHARQQLRRDVTVEEAAYASGLSGSGRLHDLFVRIDAVSPGEFRSAGLGVELRYAFAPTRFGDALMATGARGIVALRFGLRDERDTRLVALQHEWPHAAFRRCNEVAADIVALTEQRGAKERRVDLLLRGTPFQHKVWQALIEIGAGETVSYGDLAARVGQPGAARAVGSAVGANPVAILIPCHRVLRADGAIGGYRWGVGRKQSLLAWEQCAGLGESAATMLS